MGQIVHQIWIGHRMPEREQEWVAHIKEASTAAGWKHRLYNLRDLVEALPGDAAMVRIAEYGAAGINNPLLAGMISDYARIALVHNYGGLYLDTDWKLQKETWPEFPQDDEVLGQGGIYSDSQCNAIFYLSPGASSQKLDRLHTAAIARVLAYFPDPAHTEDFQAIITPFQKRPYLPSFLGPAWTYWTIGHIKYFPREFADFHFRTPKATFIHISQGRWSL